MANTLPAVALERHSGLAMALDEQYEYIFRDMWQREDRDGRPRRVRRGETIHSLIPALRRLP